ncbi:helix-turn-helix domain-containing protein [Halogeometricum luteum]|uniref:Helix-turn-helix domain-containing protein n=1 Tax=Halogeometricum luteum TaxID=2950537 RepID=A0ABU2G2Y3_9EURY|nr:helix-turn-helix domain-containing protein [Halogeometricum sp. S3BR5-2]MDS0294846.1 helix-turn-helix domain-containing protein [Halogeometricum sp. S3BR5-2]
MREFAFTVTYEEGADHLMDVFIANPGLYARTVSCHATADTMWRVDEVTGPREALSAFDEQLARLDRCSNLRGMGGCPVDLSYEVLAKRPTSRVVYSRQSEGGDCRSVPYLAAAHLGDGTLCRAEQHGREYKWRILADEDAAVGAVYDELEANLRDGFELDFERLSRSPDWADDAGGDLPLEQRKALELAVEHGYYRNPREKSLQEIAEAEGLPTSTLQYRLTRAEAWLATTFVSNGGATAAPAAESPADD